jgi:hypothetical protein
MKIRKASLILVSLVVSTLLVGCSSGVSVPDVVGSDETTAKSVIAALGVVPTVVEENSEFIESGVVIRSDPEAGSTLEPGSKVELVISKGPSRINSKNSTLEWYSISSGQDAWEFEAPYIEDDTLHVDFPSVKLKANVEWKDEYDSGAGFGQASIRDTFDKAVPIEILYDKKKSSYGQKQKLKVEVPLSDLDVDRPTTVYLQLVAFVNGTERQIKLTLNMTW